MRYDFKCEECGKVKEWAFAIGTAPRSMRTPCCGGSVSRRVFTVPQIIGTPYHLQDANRFRGDITDYKAYRRKYDKMHEKQAEQNREWSTIQAQMTGAEIVGAEEPKPLIDMYREAGGTVRG